MALDREKTLQSAQTYVDQRRFDRALDEYRKVVEADPNDARTLLKIGDIQARSEDYARAIETYDRVANFYSEQGFALKAIAVYKQVRELIVKFAPEVAEQYAHVVDRLVANYVELGLVNDALSTLDEEANRLRQANNEDEAVNVYRRMTEVGARAPIAHLRLAEGLCRVNEIDPALDSFWAAAELLVEADRHDDALRVVERMLHFKQASRYAKLAARLYLKKETQAEGMIALSKLQICFQADPKDLETLELLSEAFRVIGQAPKSLEVKKEIARQAYDQQNPEVFAAAIESLQALAPDDDQVKALSQLRLPSQPRSEAGPSERSAPTHFQSSVPEAPITSQDLEALSSHPPPPFPNSAAAPPPNPAEASAAPEQWNELDQLEPLAGEESGAPSAAVPQPPTAGIDGQDLAEVRAHTHKALVDAQTFRDLTLFDKAVETIQVALEFDPRSIELREALRDLYAESGDREGALEEMLRMAAIYVEYGRTDHANTVLLNVLDAEPEHAIAQEMLAQLDPTPPDSEPEPNDAQSEHPSVASSAPASSEPADDEAAPSGPSSSLAPVLPRIDQAPASSSFTSRPGARRPAQPPPTAPPVHDPASGPIAEPPSRPSIVPPGMQLPSFEVEDESPPTLTVEQALEKAESYALNGETDEARAVLEKQLQRVPGHPLLLEALAELDEAAEVAIEDQAPVDNDFDLHASLGELERAVRESHHPPPAGPTVDVETVFEKFKAGVKHRVAENDSATHHDLGVAYKEMNLLDDAIVELELASRDPVRECSCLVMVGQIYAENEMWSKAHSAYARALKAERKSIAQETALYYDLGSVCEKSGRIEQAVHYFEQVLARDPEHRDAPSRLASVMASNRPSLPPKPVGDDDLDRAFDELLGD